VQLKYRLYRRRNGVFYWEENDSRKQGTLRTSDRREAERLLNAMNESHREPTLNFNLARAYLAAHDPKMAQRTWQAVMDEMATHGIPSTQHRCARGFRSKAYHPIRNKPLVQNDWRRFARRHPRERKLCRPLFAAASQLGARSELNFDLCSTIFHHQAICFPTLKKLQQITGLQSFTDGAASLESPALACTHTATHGRSAQRLVDIPNDSQKKHSATTVALCTKLMPKVHWSFSLLSKNTNKCMRPKSSPCVHRKETMR
jgi:hypothetical protein